MSDFVKVKKLTSATGGTVNFPNGINIAGSDSGITGTKHTVSADEPSLPANGDTWYDSSKEIYYVRMDNAWKNWLGTIPVFYPYGDRGMAVGGGWPRVNVLQYFDITTTGNSADFGDLGVATDKATAASNGIRGLKLGGAVTSGSSTTYTQDISYWAFATLGNSSTFGNLLAIPGSYKNAAVSNGTRAVVGGGDYQIAAGSGNAYSNIMQYVTIDTTGDAQDFGDLTKNVNNCHSTSNQTRGLFALGQAEVPGGTTYEINIDYITIDTTGNAQDFGDLDKATRSSGNGIISNGTTGIFMGGVMYTASYTNRIQSITIDTLGNGSDFGDLLAGVAYGAQTGNGTRGVHMGGYNPSSYAQNGMEYITIATSGNSTDFGDLLSTNDRPAGTSGNAS